MLCELYNSDKRFGKWLKLIQSLHQKNDIYAGLEERRLAPKSIWPHLKYVVNRGESRAAAISKMECFVVIVNGWKPLTIITKHSISDVATTLDPPLVNCENNESRILALLIESLSIVNFCMMHAWLKQPVFSSCTQTMFWDISEWESWI